MLNNIFLFDFSNNLNNLFFLLTLMLNNMRYFFKNYLNITKIILKKNEFISQKKTL